jgi:hypothetical protein
MPEVFDWIGTTIGDDGKINPGKATALTANSALTVDGTWDADAATVVNNQRVRQLEIEAALVAAGILIAAA